MYRNDILIINQDNQLIRLNVPFTVLVVHEVPGLRKGDLGSVTAIRMDIRLLDMIVAYIHSYSNPISLSFFSTFSDISSKRFWYLSWEAQDTSLLVH